ncbi:cell division cycle protein 27 homolog [Phlebotomus argentipes]|uniref:cell division cycle protein 27 homolog n=1 Tax=Phlebotomus argentipes TaxID=94469 RepID=UPI0028937056|nr:cell division cycle protein 27 homolog [Phlebotomus argentipes]
MIIQEPIQAAIWHCLNHYAFRDATFLAEKLCSEVETEESIFLLATCYYRSGQVHQAFWLLQSKGARTPQARFLLSKCALELNQIHAAESALSNEDFTKQKTLDEICKDFGEIACFALQLIAKICTKTERSALASEALLRSLKLNPFLWHSFADLCDRGEKPDPNAIFQFSSTDIFATCQSQNTSNCVVVGADVSGTPLLSTTNTSILTTPVDQCIMQPGGLIVPKVLTMDESPRLTPGSESLSMSGVGSLELETPLKKQFKYLSSISPITPSFGVLPLQSPMDSGTPEVNDQQKGSGKKSKGAGQCVISRKESPLQQTKPMLNNQTGNYATRPQQTPGITGQSVRRSSRLFSSSYSVKENSKSSQNINKFVTPRSPSRKAKQQRISIINQSLSDHLGSVGERRLEKEKVETVTSADTKVLLNNSINAAQSLNQQVMAMRRQSAEGLLQLLRELGQGYLQLSQYNTREAIEHFASVAPQHYSSSWVQSMIALACHEQRDYERATKIFKEIHEREPHRLHLMEIYSTALWALQREVSLSALAQDLMGQDKSSPIPWCVAGNCFSLHKEHEIAIKFFERAVQVDPDFVYSYTLLGHEFVITEELEKAMSSFRTAIVKNQRHYNAWFGIGTIYSKQERHGLAEIHYQRALKINPRNSVLMVHIGVAQSYLGQNDRALQTFNQAMKMDAKDPLCKFHRATMFFKMGQYEEALRELEQLKELVPKESVVYYLIGKIHKKLGNGDLALMHFSWATDLDPKNANNQVRETFDATSSVVGATVAASGSAAGGSNALEPGTSEQEPASERSDDSTQLRTAEPEHSNPYDSDSF